MTKTLLDDKTIHVHRMANMEKQDIHRDYGLWIFGGGMGGCGSVDSFHVCERRYFEFYSLSHMYEGHGRLWLEDGTEQEVFAGDCILITPKTVNSYGGFKGRPYVEDNLIFCGPVADMLMRSGIAVSGVYHIGKVRSLIPIIEMYRDPAVDSQISANIALQKLLVDLYLKKRNSRQEYPALEKLMSEIKQNIAKWWTVSEMAEMCNLSDDQLRRIFVRYTGVSPKLYIDQLKLKYAAQLLAGSDMKISEISDSLGYMDPYHFSRRFKEVIGLSPRNYREFAPKIGQDESMKSGTASNSYPSPCDANGGCI